MPLERNKKEFLNQSEAITHLEVTRATFSGIEEEFGLQAFSFIGRTRERFFLKDALDLIRNSVVDDETRPLLKEKIQELQQQVRSPQTS